MNKKLQTLHLPRPRRGKAFASVPAKAPRKPVVESQPVRPSRVSQAEFDAVERDLKRLRAEQADLFAKGLLDADGHPTRLAVRQMLLRVMRKAMRPPENAGPDGGSSLRFSMAAEASQRQKFPI